MRRLRAYRIGRPSGIRSARKGLHEPAWMRKDRGGVQLPLNPFPFWICRGLSSSRGFRLNFIFQTETLSFAPTLT